MWSGSLIPGSDHPNDFIGLGTCQGIKRGLHKVPIDEPKSDKVERSPL
jgi:hypothetical protein